MSDLFIPKSLIITGVFLFMIGMTINNQAMIASGIIIMSNASLAIWLKDCLIKEKLDNE